MADWTKVWSGAGGVWNGGASCGTASSTPSACFNATGPPTPSVNILSGLPTCVGSCTDAMRYFADQLRVRTGARSCLLATASDALFTWTLKRTQKNDAVITLRPGSGCGYPVRVTYTFGAKTGAAQFQSMYDVLDWLVEAVT